jgi:hypothetical protein
MDYRASRKDLALYSTLPRGKTKEAKKRGERRKLMEVTWGIDGWRAHMEYDNMACDLASDGTVGMNG